MAWLLLLVAGVFEVVWAVFLKQSEGFTRLLPSIVTVIAMIISIVLLSWSMRSLPLGTAYAVWTGIGALGAFAVGVIWLGEDANLMRMSAAGLIICGLVLMKTATPQ